ncbi:MAG: hypothetical protein KAS32_28435 [Candidatus Peribacteraceae bacterium]|nr:hypothetical protein [Candidatus Peribacteraceae bacterium]
MKQNIFIGTERKTVDISIGIKNGHSTYVVSEHDSPRNKDVIIDVFMASDLEAAIKKAIKYDHFLKTGWINLITGDGQVCRITLDE